MRLHSRLHHSHLGKGSEQEANLVSKIEPKYLPDFLMPAKGKIEKGGMAGVGVSTTD